MKIIGAYEAKTRLSALLDEVEKGANVTITKNGRPVAVLQPVSGAAANLDDVVDELRRFAGRHRLGRVSVRALIEEGRD